MMRVLLIIAISMSVTSCMPGNSKLSINSKNKKKSDSVIESPSIISIKVINNELVISGSNLKSVTEVKINDAQTSETFSIESINNQQIVAHSLRAISLNLNKALSVILSSAEASATFPISFSLCDSSLNGKVIDCSINPHPKDVLSYDGDTDSWIPRAVNGLNYQGAWSALTALPSAVSAGDYFIVSVANPPYSVGDWIVWNGSQFDRINNLNYVTKVFNRVGDITGTKGDYTLDLMGDVDFTTDPPVVNQILKFDGSNWKPADIITPVESDPTVRAFAKVVLPTCGAGQVLKSDGANFSCVADALGAFSGTANRVVATNASGTLVATSISDTVLGYLTGVTSNIQTQIDSKLNWAISGLETIHPSRLNLTVGNAGKAVITDGSGFVTVSPTTSTQLGYLSTATSNIQTQLSSLSTAKADVTNVTQAITALRVTGLGAPTDGSDAANKTYVDSSITNNGVWTKGASNSLYYTSGAVGIGTNAPTHPFMLLSTGSTTPTSLWLNGGVTPPPVAIYADNTVAGGMDLLISGASSSGGVRPVFIGRKAGGTLDNPTALANNDTILSFLSSGYDGAAFRNNASIDFIVGDVVSAGSLPTDIIFKTGAVTRAEKMRMTSTGNLGINTTKPDAKIHIFTSSASAPAALGEESSIHLETTPSGAGIQGYTGSLWFGSREISGTEGSTRAAGIVGYMPTDVTPTNAQSDLLFFTTPNGSVVASEKMRLSSEGYIGLGNSAPTSGIHIKSDGLSGDDITIDAYSPTTAAASGGLYFRRARGDTTTQLPVEVNDVLSEIGTSGHTGSAWSRASGILTRAETTWSTTASTINSYISILTTAAGVQAEKIRITSAGYLGIGTNNPTARLDVAGTTKLGTDGVSFSSMGGCVIASTAISTTATTYTCTGVPASTAVSVHCSGSADMTTPATSSVYCRASGVLHTLTCNTTQPNSVAMTWNCMWMKI